jgi:hypothetical protein
MAFRESELGTELANRRAELIHLKPELIELCLDVVRLLIKPKSNTGSYKALIGFSKANFQSSLAVYEDSNRRGGPEILQDVKKAINEARGMFSPQKTLCDETLRHIDQYIGLADEIKKLKGM